jgi:hypothetical protein
LDPRILKLGKLIARDRLAKARFHQAAKLPGGAASFDPFQHIASEARFPNPGKTRFLVQFGRHGDIIPEPKKAREASI